MKLGFVRVERSEGETCFRIPNLPSFSTFQSVSGSSSNPSVDGAWEVLESHCALNAGGPFCSASTSPHSFVSALLGNSDFLLCGLFLVPLAGLTGASTAEASNERSFKILQRPCLEAQEP